MQLLPKQKKSFDEFIWSKTQVSTICRQSQNRIKGGTQKGTVPISCTNMAKTTTKKDVIETVEPIGERVLIRKDEDRKVTKVGIHLPGKIEIPTLTGRVVTVSTIIENNPDYPIQQYDKVLFNPKQSIPVDFEGDNRLFVVPIEDIVAIFRRDT